MFEFGVALLFAAFAAGLLIAFRRQHSLKRRIDRLMLDHNLLADRVLLLSLNRVPAQATEPSSPERSSDGRRETGPAETEVHRIPSPRPVT
jgi:hypothetical protein